MPESGLRGGGHTHFFFTFPSSVLKIFFTYSEKNCGHTQLEVTRDRLWEFFSVGVSFQLPFGSAPSMPWSQNIKNCFFLHLHISSLGVVIFGKGSRFAFLKRNYLKNATTWNWWPWWYGINNMISVIQLAHWLGPHPNEVWLWELWDFSGKNVSNTRIILWHFLIISSRFTAALV